MTDKFKKESDLSKKIFMCDFLQFLQVYQLCVELNGPGYHTNTDLT